VFAFKPSGAIKGIKTGWLLIPALIAGMAAIIFIVKGVLSAPVNEVLFSNNFLLWGGILVYIILLVATGFFLKRQVTTELLLIVGWAMLVLAEVNMLYGIGQLTHTLAIIFIVVIAAAALISLVCYLLYYSLGAQSGFFDGMVPLLLASIVMASISVTISS
jgi:hypothetical protein